MKIFDLVIVGGGPVGLFSAFYAGRRGMSTLVVESSDVLGGLPYSIYSEKQILDIPGYSKVTGYDLTKKLIEQAKSDLLTVRTGTKVESCAGSVESGFTLKCMGPEGEAQISAATVLLATGSGEINPRTIGVYGEDIYKDKGVYYFVPSKESLRGKKVVVVGGGDSALDWVDLLNGVAEQIHLVHRREEFKAQEASIQRLKQSNAILHLNAEVKAIHGDECVQSVDLLAHGEVLNVTCDTIVIALGFRIQLESLASWGLETDHSGVIVNPSMETNIPGIFAAGDVAVTPGVGSTKLIAVGFAQGCIAVNTAKTRIDPKAKFFPGHSTAWK